MELVYRTIHAVVNLVGSDQTVTFPSASEFLQILR
jgi:hypothetical protein